MKSAAPIHTGTAGGTPILVDPDTLKSEALVKIILKEDYVLSDLRPPGLPVIVEEDKDA